ncbi:MAG TPA: isochorismatase family protein [Tepidisphaeraceae bacterium]|jgi:nicotinamidase-related amidase
MSDACASSVHPHTLRLGNTALLIVDMQEAFRPAVIDFDAIAARIATLVQGCKLLDVPILATEQVPEKLGRTASSVLGALPPTTPIIDKTAFSCCGAAAFLDQLAATRCRQILVAGLETHICVNQTVHDLLAADYQVHLLTDCLTSRTETNRQTALAKMQSSGALPSSIELALFELMRDAKHEQFRAVSKLIK